MDGQNFQNEQNSVEEQRVQTTNNYQDYTTNVQTQYTSYNQPAPKQTNVLAIVSLVFGILSILCCCSAFIGSILGIVGVICGILAQKQSKSGMAIAGIICSALGIVLGIAMTIFSVYIMIASESTPYNYYY